MVLYFKVISSIYYLFMNMYGAPFKIQHACYLLCNYCMLGFIYNKTIHRFLWIWAFSFLEINWRSGKHYVDFSGMVLIYTVLFQNLSSFSLISSKNCWGGNSVPITSVILSCRHDNRARRIWGRFLAAPLLSPSSSYYIHKGG